MRLAIICLKFIFPLMVFGQMATVTSTKQNILYFGVSNPLAIVAENLACDSLIVSSSIGQLRGRDCRYEIYFPAKDTARTVPTSATISVKGIRNADTISVDNFQFRVREIPLPIAKVANRSGGTITAAEFKVQTGVATQLEDFDFECPVTVISYSLLLHNSIRTTHFYDVKGAYFSPEIKDYLFYLRSGDKVFVFDVEARLCNGEIVTLKPIQFDIK